MRYLAALPDWLAWLRQAALQMISTAPFRKRNPPPLNSGSPWAASL